MLSYFAIQNFKSILNLKLDLSFAEGKAPNNYEDSEFLPFIGTHARNVPVLALYGANGSGKTNVLQALNTFMRAIVFGVQGIYHPNKLNPKYTSTTFEMGVYKEDTLYIYTISYNQKGISHEALYKKNKERPIFDIKEGGCYFDKISTNEYTSQRLEEIYKVECKNAEDQQIRTFLSRVARNYVGLNQELVTAWKQLTDFIEIYPQNDIPLPYVLERLAKNQTPEKISEAFNRITDILKKLDININKMTWDRKYQVIEDPAKPMNGLDENVTFYRPSNNVLVKDNIRSYHTDVNGKEVVFNFNEESSGTITLASVLGLCLCALDRGSILCIDELDRSLHSRLLVEIVRMFKDKRYNKTNAELLFTAHNTDILDDGLMRVSEVGFINKTEREGSTIKRISDFGGKRNVTNFRKQYLDGLFSGVPFPYI